MKQFVSRLVALNPRYITRARQAMHFDAFITRASASIAIAKRSSALNRRTKPELELYASQHLRNGQSGGKEAPEVRAS